MSTIPVALTEEQFITHIKPQLSVAKRGFESDHPLWKIFNLVLYVVHTGCQWPETPVPKDANEQPMMSWQVPRISTNGVRMAALNGCLRPGF